MRPVAEARSFGRYELVKLVGTGGMALVHLARQRGPEGFVKPCVLKRISPDALRHDGVRRMFIEEARVSALLNHPNIVQTFDYGSVDGAPYMALELIDGVNLAQFCRALAGKKRWLPVRPAVDICLKLLDALQYAHELTDLDDRPLRIVHRDVSPQNTLLSRQGVVKLADFGIARHEARAVHTRVGDSAKGKPGYMAPEQAMGDAVDARADLFSVGILLTELVSARRVMSNNRRPVGVLGIADRIEELFAYRPEAPAELESVAQRLCAVDPSHRPDTAQQAAAELRAAMEAQTVSHPLEQFLKQVFRQHFPGDTLGAALNKGTPQSPSPPPPEMAFGDDPTEGQLPSAPSEPADIAENEIRTAWARPEHLPEGESTGQVYEEGWPREFLPETEPQLQLVSRSATVDAMKYFAAEESAEVQRREAGPTSDPVHTPELHRALNRLGGQDAPTQPEDAATPKRPPPGLRKRKTAEIPPVVPLALAGLAVVVVGLIVMSWFSERETPATRTIRPATGQLTVTSDPGGGVIYIGGRSTGATTPKTLADLPVDAPMHVSVRLPGHRTIPRDLTLKIPAQSGQTSAHFRLRPGRAFTLQTEPAGSTVTMGGARLGELTPLVLETIPFGETATITIEQPGFMPHQLKLKATEDTPADITVKLEEAVEVEVLSEPPGADVFVDGQPRGRTPLYDLLVPKQRRFRVTVKKVGFKRWRRRIRRKDDDGPLIARLTYLPLMQMPMSRSERSEARGLQQAIDRLSRDVNKLKTQLKRAQHRLERLEARSSPLIGPIAEAQRNVDLVRDELSRREDALAEARSKQDVFRDQILLKAEMEN